MGTRLLLSGVNEVGVMDLLALGATEYVPGEAFGSSWAALCGC